MHAIKNIPIGKVFALADEVAYLPGQVVSKIVAQNSAVSITVFAFDKGEEISTHASHGDALVMVMDGQARITIEEKVHELSAGESILMPADKPHALYALDCFKMLLTVVFPVKAKNSR